MKEFDFNNVGRRMPYDVPEGFFESAKLKAKNLRTERSRSGRVTSPIAIWVTAAAAAILAVCGVALWLEDFNSPESRYERMLADVSTDVLWEYAYNHDVEIETDDELYY